MTIMLYGFLRIDLDPLRQTKSERIRENYILTLIQFIVFAWSSPFFIARSSASLLWYLRHSSPIPPVVVKTRGVKVPFSFSKTLVAYQRFFPCWCICFGLWWMYVSALGWQTFTLKKTELHISQNPLAWISSLASADLFVPGFNTSPVISCNTGSICTSLQTVFKSSAFRSRSSLCLIVINPPFAYDHCMVCIEVVSAYTHCWLIRGRPIIS